MGLDVETCTKRFVIDIVPLRISIFVRFLRYLRPECTLYYLLGSRCQCHRHVPHDDLSKNATLPYDYNVYELIVIGLCCLEEVFT